MAKSNENENEKNSREDLEDSLSPLAMASMQMHELYTELRKSGFNRSEALYLVVKMAAGTTED